MFISVVGSQVRPRLIAYRKTSDVRLMRQKHLGNRHVEFVRTQRCDMSLKQGAHGLPVSEYNAVPEELLKPRCGY